MSGPNTKIVAVGAAVQDVFLSHSPEFAPVSDKSTHEQFMQLDLGAKADVNNITFSTGGGATNAAVTFARQGLPAVFMGTVGHDPAGHAVIDDLDREGVDAPARRAAGTVRLHIAPEPGRPVVEHAFGQHAARRVVGAQDEDMAGHGPLSSRTSP